MKSKFKSVQSILLMLSGLVVLILLILYMGGFFRTGLVGPGRVKIAEADKMAPEKIGRASVDNVPEWYEAVGTVRSRTEAQISAQMTGRIMKILVRPGDKVQKGEVLIELDDREFRARVDQARQGLEAAKARRDQAKQALIAAQAAYAESEANYKRIKSFFEQEAATRRDLEKAEAGFKQAKAGVRQAKEGMAGAEAGVRQAQKVLEEARVALGYAKVNAPEAGEVAKRLAEPGDLAQPGKPLLILQAPGALRLEAHVREGLIKKVLPGSQLRVVINAVDATLNGTVEEVIPSADPLSRTFLVKVGIPAVTGLYPGMFGRLLVRLGERQAVVVPKNAVYRIGQMEVVKVHQQGRWCNCFVKTGKALNGKIEILSGLTGNEEIALRTGGYE